MGRMCKLSATYATKAKKAACALLAALMLAGSQPAALVVRGESIGPVVFHTDDPNGELSRAEVNAQLMGLDVDWEDPTATFYAEFDLSVEKIGPWAFYDWRTNLTGASIAGNVKTIGEASFTGCRLLNELNLESPLQRIEVLAFGECISITNITLPASVDYVSDEAFGWCGNLSNISVDSGNAAYSSYDGMLLDITGTKLVICPPMLPGGAITIPDTVTEIGPHAFYFVSSLVDFNIPPSVERIAPRAFVDCPRLFAVSILGNDTEIGIPAFYDCTSLFEVSVNPNNTAYKVVDGVLLVTLADL